MTSNLLIHKRTRNDFEKEPIYNVKKSYFENSFDESQCMIEDWKQLEPTMNKLNEFYIQHLTENNDFADLTMNKELEQSSFLQCYKFKKYIIPPQLYTSREHSKAIKMGVLNQIDYAYLIEDEIIIFFPLSQFFIDDNLCNGLTSSSFKFEKNIVDIGIFENNTATSKKFIIIIAYAKTLNFHDVVINLESPIFIDSQPFQMMKIEDGIEKLIIHQDNIYYLNMNNHLKRIMNKKKGSLNNFIDFFHCNLMKLKTEFNVIFNERKKLRKLIYDDKKFLFFGLFDHEKKQEILIYSSSLANLFFVGNLCSDSINEK